MKYGNIYSTINELQTHFLTAPFTSWEFFSFFLFSYGQLRLMLSSLVTVHVMSWKNAVVGFTLPCSYMVVHLITSLYFFQEAIQTHPKFSTYSIHKRINCEVSELSMYIYTMNCKVCLETNVGYAETSVTLLLFQACGRTDHPSSQGIKFSGMPYNRETFETEDFGSYAKVCLFVRWMIVEDLG